MNLRYKLFSGFVLLIIIPLFLLGTITFTITFQMIEKKYSEQTEFSMQAMGHSIRSVFKEVEKIIDNGIANNIFQLALISPNEKDQDLVQEKDNDFDINRGDGTLPVQPSLKATDLKGIDYLEMNDRQQIFRRLLFNHPSISYAFLYNLKGYTYYPGSGYTDIIPIFAKENFKTMPFEEFIKHPIYDEVMNSKGSPVWLGPNEIPELTGSEQVFTQIKVVKDLYTLKNLGVLIVQVNDWDIETFFNNFYHVEQMRNSRFFIVNENGLILFDNEKKLNGNKLPNYLAKPIEMKEGYHSYKDKFNDQDSVLSFYEIPEYGWHLVSVHSWNSLSNEMMEYIKWVSIIMLICVLGALLFLFLFMNRVTKHIVRTVRFMRRVEEGDLQARVDEEGQDELRLLSRGFNRLIDRVTDLLEQVKQEQQQKNKAEMRVLQAQIKPHFLFNTLESINVLAIQNEGRKVSHMVHRLGNILRISIQDKEEITIRQELEYLMSYLEIQKFRFEDVFNFEFDVPDELMHCMIQKLTLQPLVENCIQHGFDGISYTGLIRISACSIDGRIILKVEDNGVGIPAKQLMRFQYMQDDDSRSLIPQEEKALNMERRGLGVRSVADRIRIQYGSQYGLFICSAPNEGTIIQCTIPRYEQGENK
ncbi:sensor histidine kinase [Paenibacillus agilis]|uniref:Sensor histidine kinase n=1 Tax=Paenibacillus agilis TaxID=3020863 RepID=A0A559IYQ2_9BACL|nr:sensor histidine kinase [Paenibacillus agilis]TVX92763.1 sensor histidine kinase [Paenibacillus agilis]